MEIVGHKRWIDKHARAKGVFGVDGHQLLEEAAKKQKEIDQKEEKKKERNEKKKIKTNNEKFYHSKNCGTSIFTNMPRECIYFDELQNVMLPNHLACQLPIFLKFRPLLHILQDVHCVLNVFDTHFFI